MKADFSRVTLTLTTAEFKTLQNLYDFFNNYKSRVMDDESTYFDFIDAFGYEKIDNVNRDLRELGICVVIDDGKGE